MILLYVLLCLFVDVSHAAAFEAQRSVDQYQSLPSSSSSSFSLFVDVSHPAAGLKSGPKIKSLAESGQLKMHHVPWMLDDSYRFFKKRISDLEVSSGGMAESVMLDELKNCFNGYPKVATKAFEDHRWLTYNDNQQHNLLPLKVFYFKNALLMLQFYKRKSDILLQKIPTKHNKFFKRRKKCLEKNLRKLTRKDASLPDVLLQDSVKHDHSLLHWQSDQSSQNLVYDYYSLLPWQLDRSECLQMQEFWKS